MNEPVDDAWIAAFRRKLAGQGAVAYFDNPTENDRLAMSVYLDRLAWGIPGSGVYARGSGIYAAHFTAGRLANGIECGCWSADQWRAHLQECSPRLRFVVPLPDPTDKAFTITPKTRRPRSGDAAAAAYG